MAACSSNDKDIDLDETSPAVEENTTEETEAGPDAKIEERIIEINDGIPQLDI